MNGRKLLVIAFDGFRWDYCDRYDLPSLKRFTHEGARASFVKPVFPTLTFPNFYSVATGRYPENHGVMANDFHDPVTGGRFILSDFASQQDARWYTMNDCEPFWITAKKSGLKVGAFHWVISEVDFKDENGELILLERNEKRMDDSNRFRIPPFEARIDTSLGWIVNDSLDLTLLYMDEPDHSTHEYGPDSEKVEALLRQIDTAVGYLLNKVDELGLTSSLDIIIMSDHGMTSCPPDNRFLLPDLVSPSCMDELELLETGPVCMIRARNGRSIQESAISELRSAERNFRVFLKDEVPDRFHWKGNSRAPDLMLLCDEHYCACSGELDENKFIAGQHGYDNELTTMRAILFARGPSFKTQFVTTVETQIIDTYRLVCKLLQITPRKNDSTDDTVFSLLK